MKTLPQIQSAEELEKVLLKNRGLKSVKQIDQFYNPKLEYFQKELKIPGIKSAVSRIDQAIKNSEKIIVYGDYDADGLTAAATVYLAIRKKGGDILPYIPHREKEGYGLSKLGLDWCQEKKAKLVITVDNGIVAFDAAKYSKHKEMDLIITDHHVALEKLPPSLAIVHSTIMSGVGVAWALIKGLVGDDEARQYLDLAAIGSICDLIPLIGVNRSLVKEGLKIINRSPRVGLQALIKECKLEGEITAQHISHIIGPRINAVGRLDSAMDGLRLFCTQEPDKAKILARRLSSSNDLKKQLTDNAIQQARDQIGQIKNDIKIVILQSETWIPGIIGLMAGKIAEEYKLPTIIISRGKLISKASARTVNGLDIIKTIRNYSDLLIDVGGHPKAAGFTIETKKIEHFSQKISQDLKGFDLSNTRNSLVEVLAEIKKISKSWLQVQDKFEPFGIDNPRPLFRGINVRVDDLKTVGAGKHLKLKVDGIEAIAFSMGEYEKLLKPGSFININFYPEINRFNGSEILQLKIVDLKID